MELIAASRIVKAQQRIHAARPYAEAITGVVGAVTSQSGNVDHVLTTPRDNVSKAAVLLITSDRGLAGGYSANVLRAGEQLNAQLRSNGTEPVPFLVGRKALGFYRFRGRDTSRQWTGFSEQPTYDDAKAVADALIEAFSAEGDEGVQEIYVVYTEFRSIASQRAVAVRVLPVTDEALKDATEEAESGQQAQFEFEPGAEGVLDALLPRYLEARVYTAMLDAAASEQAARQRAMKSATDNADELIKSLTREANAARQAEITQEIMEIVGGAEALAKSGSDS
jgi:F-type H+-transporting ATPase subunit gamma